MYVESLPGKRNIRCCGNAFTKLLSSNGYTRYKANPHTVKKKNCTKRFCHLEKIVPTKTNIVNIGSSIASTILLLPSSICNHFLIYVPTDEQALSHYIHGLTLALMVWKIRGSFSHILDLGTTQYVGEWSVLRSAAQAVGAHCMERWLRPRGGLGKRQFWDSFQFFPRNYLWIVPRDKLQQSWIYTHAIDTHINTLASGVPWYVQRTHRSWVILQKISCSCSQAITSIS